MNQTTFESLPLGSNFTFHGRAFTKIVMSLAEDERRNGTIFTAET